MRCSALFIGGIKSGKSSLAEEYILKCSKQKPIYLATTEFFDQEMQKKIELHKQNRKNRFITVEEPIDIFNIIKNSSSAILVECVSMWINNMLYHKFTQEDIENEIDKILQLDKDVVFVINDVSKTVVSQNKLVREFTNINGIVSQKIAHSCNDVYNITAGIAQKIK
jgi:adenosylcobinamide kinase/adenosylcobinamide-phosphate guanylyltransferase